MSHDKEWRYYGGNDSKHSSDPNRVQARKIEERTIYKDVDQMGFSEKLVTEANLLYIQVTNNRIFRGNSRRAIVFACIYNAYKTSGNYQSHAKLIETFKITRKSALKGLRHVSLNASNESRTTYVTPISLVEEIMNEFGATTEQKSQVIAYYELIKNKSSKLNRSRPQSVASGLVYYWIKKEGKLISIKDFAEKIKLSELTITNIVKEITSLLKE
jgi:transcription initiation factor TFIIIB Brf1 subunit/transcription initiation factor TFIIB